MNDISKKLKDLRVAKQMTLKELASKAGCTGAYLSRMEKGTANPSIMILKKVVAVLGISIGDLFHERQTGKNGIVLKQEERRTIAFENGKTRIQMLVRDFNNKLMQPFINIIEPGGGSDGSYSHAGEEFGIVLQGVLEFHVNGERYVVRKNQSFYFLSEKSHEWFNPSKRKTVVIWVTSPSTF